jgi:hypothetical protein
MDLSVIIVNWNTKTFLLQCLESLDRGAGDTEMEVWVVDNGSIDGSGAAVRERFPEVTLIENPMNFGFGRASNQAMRRSQGTYVLLLSRYQVKPRAIEGSCLLWSTTQSRHCGSTTSECRWNQTELHRQLSVLSDQLLNKSLLRWLFRSSQERKTIRAPLSGFLDRRLYDGATGSSERGGMAG